MADRLQRLRECGVPKEQAGYLVRWGNSATLTSATLGLLLIIALIDRDLCLYIIGYGGGAIGGLAGLVFGVTKVKFLRNFLLNNLLRNRVIFEKQGGNVLRFYMGVLIGLGGLHPKLYEFQNALPPLPVPGLKKTVEKYLDTVRPLLTDAEFGHTQQVAREFIQKEGPSLHSALVSMQKKTVNWLEEWWEKYIYLSSRESLVTSSNWWGTDRLADMHQSQVRRSSRIIHAKLTFKDLIDTQDLEPLRIYNALPLCMWQYTRLFGTSRIPGESQDTLVTDADSRHLVVLRKGQFFRVDVYPQGKLLSVAELEIQIQQIIDEADKAGEQPPVAALTGLERTRWSQLRQQLIADGNQNALQTVESALFCVALDDTEPKTVQDLADMAHVGPNAHNRWFDKSFNLIMYKNGKLSANVEHSWADAPVIVHLFDFVFGIEDAPPSKYESELRGGLPMPQKLVWRLSPSMRDAVMDAKDKLAAMIGVLDLKVQFFQQYGKGAIKQFKMSPDAFVQMAAQLAYYRLYGKFVLTYESAQTRQFLHGRTETGRTCSNQSRNWVLAMEDSSVFPKEKLRLLRLATARHRKYMMECMDGEGVDRFLFGLKVAALGSGQPLPDFFTDKAYNQTFKLSSSQTPGQRTTGGGFAPVVFDGIGMSYVVSEDVLTFHISTYHACPETDSQRFMDAIESSLNDMHSICISPSYMKRNLSKGELTAEDMG
eukprot:TRINITY_DN549_c1_g1_i1.p1 TRINITY_DN549_c1_g1~~TRINITY_DN549_c1_g1_i1.p1  ORF type:complete len:711 (-),score=184.05 TRINITY_DN549_c1_g1_i1:7-2139(-)